MHCVFLFKYKTYEKLALAFCRRCNSLIDKNEVEPHKIPAIANHAITMLTPDNTNAIATTAIHSVDEISNMIDSRSHIDSKRDKLLALIFSK